MNQTILVTGGTGYIGSWVVKKLLDKGYTVRITVRDLSKQGKFKHLLSLAEKTQGELELFEADLLKSGSYDKAADGSNAIIHVASPFSLHFKDAVKEIIEPAIEGTKNVLSAASNSNTVKKVVLTSSVAAVHGDNADMQDNGLSEFTEDDYNTSSTEKHQPYSYSKIKAELAAWELAKNQDQWQLVVINPSFVMGPPLTQSSNTESIQFMKDLLSGKFLPGAPALEFGFVDVRDVAEAHILALENGNAHGRHILAERTMGVMDLVKVVKKNFPGKYPLPFMTSPKFMLYLVGWAFGLTSKFISRNVGYSIKLNNTKSKEELGLTYTPIEITIKDMILTMQEMKMVKS